MNVIFAVTSGNHFREDCYKVQLKTKSGVRLANEAMHALKQLSMLPDAEMGLAPRQDIGVGMAWTWSKRGSMEGLNTVAYTSLIDLTPKSLMRCARCCAPRKHICQRVLMAQRSMCRCH